MKTFSGAALAILVLVLGTTQAQNAPPQGAFEASHFALELDGTVVGFLRSISGGEITAPPTYQMGQNSCTWHKIPGPAKYGEVTLQFGPSMNPVVYSWISSFMSCEHPRRNGAIVVADFHHRERSRREFTNALITEVTLPPCDPSSRDAASMTVKFKPEYIRDVKGDGKAVTPDLSKRQKAFHPANFRLTIEGVDTTHVAKVEELTLKQKVVENPIGENRDPGQQVGPLEIPDLVVSVPDAHAESFFDWFKSFVINGNNDESKHKNGSLVYLSPNLQDSLLTLNLKRMGIYSMEPGKYDVSAEGVHLVKFRIAIECMELLVPAVDSNP